MMILLMGKVGCLNKRVDEKGNILGVIWGFRIKIMKGKYKEWSLDRTTAEIDTRN
jgi:hypothetical protein